MAYYLKVVSDGRMKKFVVHPNRFVSLRQVKISLGLDSEDQEISYEIYSTPLQAQSPKKKQQNQENIRLEEISSILFMKNDEEFLRYLQENQFPNGSSLKIRLIKKAYTNVHKEEEDDEQDIEIPGPIKKLRSKSEEISPFTRTNFYGHSLIDFPSQEFDMCATQQFLFQSMIENKSKLEEVQGFIESKRRCLNKFKEEMKHTETQSLLNFLKCYK